MADYTLTAKITADPSGFRAGFQKAQESLANLQSRVNQTGKSLQTIGKSISDFGNKLTRNITAPAVGAASALASITLVKGFNRLVGIDEARAKLKGLGHDAKAIESIMESALAS